LKHLTDDGAEAPQVVAITFTDRAAREMRDRIRKAVQDKLQNAQGEAVDRWTDHLRHLETAPISTIHAFCGNLLRQYAVTAGLDPQFEILEEVLASNLRSESMRQRLQDLLTTTSPQARDLAALVIDFGWLAAVQAIRYLAGRGDPVGWQRWLTLSADQVAQSWLGAARDRLRERYVDYLVAADAKIAPFMNLLRVAPCSDAGTKANVQRILNDTPKLGTAADLAGAMKVLHESAKFGKLRAKAWHNDQDIYDQVRDASEDYRKALAERLAPFIEDPGNLEAAILTGQRFVRVAFEIWEAYQARKQRAGCLDFQDLLVLARDLLRDHADVRDAVRKRFRFILLDETQDIDPVQMELISLLCSDVEIEAGKLFAVGDQKQSIYRFRGAEVRLFRELRERVPERGRMQLSRNYRSQPPILDFVNALCSARMPEYEPLEPNRPSIVGEPSVEFLWSVPESDAGKESVSEIRRREADTIARRVRQMVESGERRVWDAAAQTLRPVQMEDVVLLFRSMSNVSIYEEALRRHGLDYYLVGGRAFFAQQEIYDLYHLLRALENPADSMSLAGALRSPFCCLNDETLFLVGAEKRGDLWKGFHEGALNELPNDQRDALLRARLNLERWRSLKDRLPIVRLIGEIFADSGYDAAMQFEFMGDRKLANLWKLQDLARTFDSSGMFGLPEFIQRLGELVREQPREEQAATLPEKANVIKLMSIHQAKGLEFPVVIVPDLAAKTQSGRTQVIHWNDELGCLVRPPEDDKELFSDFGEKLGAMADAVADWEEDLRILYVACTRAEDMLILSAGFREPLPQGDPRLPIPITEANTWIMTLGERFNLRTGECIALDVDAKKRPQVRVQLATGMLAAPERKKTPSPLAQPEIQKLPALPKPALPSLLMLPVLERMALDSKRKKRFWPKDLDANDTVQYVFVVQTDEQRLLDNVLSFWDLREKDGWKQVLDICVDDEGSMEADSARDVLEKWLPTFVSSDLYKAVRGSEYVEGHDEFFLSIPDMSLPPCRGWIDIWFRGGDGAFRIIGFHTDKEVSLAEAAKSRKPFLALQAEAIRRQTGQECLAIDLFDMESGAIQGVEKGDAAEGWQIIKKLVASVNDQSEPETNRKKRGRASSASKS
jgi:ATP-dependent helicase/nuclease subunit A